MKYISKGAAHIHTTYSDGTGTIKQIASDARKAGLDWIIITDHNNLEGLENSEEGYINDVAVIIGEEISPDYSDHYLAFDINKTVSPEQPPQDFINEVNSQGGFGFIAHPDKPEHSKSKKLLSWTDWNIKNFQGLEIWNHLADWGDSYDENKKLYSYFFRENLLRGPTRKVLNWWDRLNNENDHIFPALGGLDVHAFNYKCLKVFSYYKSFKTLTNYLFLEKELSSDFKTAKRQVLDAIKSGNNLIVNRVWSGKSDNLKFYIHNGSKIAYVGDKISNDPSLELNITVPKKANISLFHNGLKLNEVNSKTFSCKDIKPGKYRFEAYYKNKPWIFSNPIICE